MLTDIKWRHVTENHVVFSLSSAYIFTEKRLIITPPKEDVGIAKYIFCCKTKDLGILSHVPWLLFVCLL